MKLTHKQKVKKARKMRKHWELVRKVPIFQTEAWTKRREAIAKRLSRRCQVPMARWRNR